VARSRDAAPIVQTIFAVAHERGTIMHDPDPNDPRHKGAIDTGGDPDQQHSDAAEERGERNETGRHVARGGKQQGDVNGASGDEKQDPRSGKA
jgi:hypothetical protein